MKFITEDELRDIYRIHPFTTYEVEPGVRLTPGARQFLADRGIRTSDEMMPEASQINFAASTTASAVSKSRKSWRMRKLESEFKSIEATFLLSEEELLKSDILVAQKLIKLCKQFDNIMKASLCGDNLPEDIDFNDCTGLNKNNLACALGDCFEISEFHMQLNNGREILLIHKLRCELNRLEAVLMETGETTGEIERYEQVAGKINQIINSLSQIICTAVGGKECQRNS